MKDTKKVIPLRGNEGKEKVNKYAEKVIKDFITDLTDQVFLTIEHDDIKMREYMSKVNEFGQTVVNTTIDKMIKEMFNLENNGRNEKPKSRILQSYERYKIKKKGIPLIMNKPSKSVAGNHKHEDNDIPIPGVVKKNRTHHELIKLAPGEHKSTANDDSVPIPGFVPDTSK